MSNGRNDKGQFTNNNPGKPKGATSERVKVWNEIGEWFKSEGLEKYKENLIALMNSDKSAERAEGMKRYEALINYFSPKLSSTELKAPQDNKITVTYESEPIPTSPETETDKE